MRCLATHTLNVHQQVLQGRQRRWGFGSGVRVREWAWIRDWERNPPVSVGRDWLGLGLGHWLGDGGGLSWGYGWGCCAGRYTAGRHEYNAAVRCVECIRTACMLTVSGASDAGQGMPQCVSCQGFPV